MWLVSGKSAKMRYLRFSIFSTSRWCRPPNLEAVAQGVFVLQYFSIQIIIADFKKKNTLKTKQKNNKKNKHKKTKQKKQKQKKQTRHVKELLRGRVLYSVYYYRMSPRHYELNWLQADWKKSNRLM